MLLIGKEEFMQELGTSQEEQDDLVPLTFDTFRNLQVGDVVYLVDDWDYFIKVPFVVDYAKWLPSPEGVYTSKGKSFFISRYLLNEILIKDMQILQVGLIPVYMFVVLCLRF